MKKHSKMSQRIIIQQKLDTLAKRQELLEQEWEAFKEKCNHEIMVTMTYVPKEQRLCYISSHSTYCLFCREHLSPRKYYPDGLAKKLESSTQINLEDYPNLVKEWKKRCIIELDKMYQEIRKENPKALEYEIGEMMKRRLDAMDVLM